MTQRKRSTTACAVVIRGDASERARAFQPGHEIAPFSVGAQGDWRVAANGVEAQHFYLCFDGRTLFAAASVDGPIASLGGKRLTARWTKIPDGSVLTFGAASLAVRNPAERSPRSGAVPVERADPRGPRIVDPFACETLAFASPTRQIAARRDPLDEPTRLHPELEPTKIMPVPSEPVDDPTLVYRPWAREFALKPLNRSVEAALAKTIARPVMAPMAATISAPVPRAAVRPPAVASALPAPAKRGTGKPTVASTGQTPLIRKCIAALIVAALLLLGVRALTQRERIPPVKAAAPTGSSSNRTALAISGSASERAARSDDEPPNAEISPPPMVNGKTAERQAVDLVARGAYSEAAALYGRLAGFRDSLALREAARIARRKARVAR
ncbi:MAG TPA: hypothetical protein VJV79_15435 [Polyangiaceae bacterium]|nr:hypothetical protein [Polyangiaceae bacterium]